MTNTYLLREKIRKLGLKYRFIAHYLGLSPTGLHRKVENRNEFKANEIQKLCDLLGISTLQEKERIFFAELVD